MNVAQLARVPNWDMRLIKWARGLVDEPYVWGLTDCGSLARGALWALYEADPLGDLSWDSEETALEALEALGGLETALREVGARELPIRFAQSGDLLVEREGNADPARLYVMVAGNLLYTLPDDGVHLMSVRELPERLQLWRLP